MIKMIELRGDYAPVYFDEAFLRCTLEVATEFGWMGNAVQLDNRVFSLEDSQALAHALLKYLKDVADEPAADGVVEREIWAVVGFALAGPFVIEPGIDDASVAQELAS